MTDAIRIIRYRPEWTARGWVVWRSVVLPGATSAPERAVDLCRPQTHGQLEDALRGAARSDTAACTRLGLTATIIVEPERFDVVIS